jgi:hypothetical protein
MIKHYGSIAEMCDAYLALPRASNSETVHKGYTGDTSLVAMAEAQIALVETQIETPRAGWARSPAGAFCAVPDVLAGLPTPMRRRTYVPHEGAPITIIVGTASSGGLSPSVFRRRGITIVALVMALARIRPISLHIMDPSYGPPEPNGFSGETVIMSRVNTTPFDLATACYVLTEISFTTTVMYRLEEHVTGRVTWPTGYTQNPQAYYDGLCDRMKLERSDTLIIRDAFLGDSIITQPVMWLNEQVRRFTTMQEDNPNV